MSDTVADTVNPQTTDNDWMRDQKKYLAHMRHELRTPINALIGYSEMLTEDATDQSLETLLPLLDRIHAAGKQLLLLVNDLLEQSKVEAGQADLESETYRTSLSEALRPSIQMAIEAIEPALKEVNTLQAKTMVADLERMQTAAHRFVGLIDELLHYGVQAQAQAVPVVEGEEVVETQETAPSRPGVLSRATEETEHGLILIVDDNDANRDMLSRRLVRQGHTVVMAENGRRALELVKKTNFDLVLLDILMPEVNGYEVLERLKADEATRDIPVIMISALDEIDSVVRCIEMGAEDFLPKPFNAVLLRARIGASLEKKRFRDQEVAYLRAVSQVTASAAAMEANEFEPDSLDEVASRSDALGALGRVFQNMAREVIAREQRLRQQLQELKIEVDEAKKAREVAAITDTDYFKTLQEKAHRMRQKRHEDLPETKEAVKPPTVILGAQETIPARLDVFAVIADNAPQANAESPKTETLPVEPATPKRSTTRKVAPAKKKSKQSKRATQVKRRRHK